MTKVIISMTREDGPAYFEVMEHTGYKNEETGNNDLCVAVSTLVGMFGRWMEKKYGIEPVILVDGHARFVIDRSNTRINELLRAIETEIRALAEEFPDNLKIY